MYIESNSLFSLILCSIISTQFSTIVSQAFTSPIPSCLSGLSKSVQRLHKQQSYSGFDKCTNDCQRLGKGKKLRVQCNCCTDQLDRIPPDIDQNVTALELQWLNIREINEDSFRAYENLVEIYLINMPNLKNVDANAFRILPKLRKLKISNAKQLIVIDNTFVQRVPGQFVFSISNSGLAKVPSFRMTRNDRSQEMDIQLRNNQLETLRPASFAGLILTQLDLAENHFTTIVNDTFAGARLEILKLNYNWKLSVIDPNAFRGIKGLRALDVSHTNIKLLPSVGLSSLTLLRAQGVERMKTLPPLETFQSLTHADMTYPYHCCLFQFAKVETLHVGSLVAIDDGNPNLCSSAAATTSRAPVWSEVERSRSDETISRGKRMADVMDYESYQYNEVYGFGNFHPDAETVAYYWPTHGPKFVNKPVSIANIERVFCKTDSDYTIDLDQLSNHLKKVICTPQPNAMNPCEDVMGNIGLRVAVWFVWLLAVVGNLSVFVALRLTWHNRGMEVHNFLMLNVAFADLVIGVYLSMLAVQDVRTAGQYYNYAVDWQTGVGCRLAGFLAVFASELCIYCMMLMSIEIFYKTYFAIHAKRIKISVAVALVLVGWLVGLVFATLPLVGLSSYSATSTCLPLRMDSVGDRAYLILALVLNFLFFAGICGCYIALWLTVRDRANTSVQAQDIALAKRMALLIGTDFLCWAPTIFFGLTAVGGKPLISISIAKFFLVLFYPINSMTNPFIYVFFTKMFRKSVGRFMRHSRLLQRWYKPRHSRTRTTSTMNSRSISTTVMSFFSGSRTSGSEYSQSMSPNNKGRSSLSTDSSDNIASDRKRQSTPNLKLTRLLSRNNSSKGMRASLSSNGSVTALTEITSPDTPLSPSVPLLFTNPMSNGSTHTPVVIGMKEILAYQNESNGHAETRLSDAHDSVIVDPPMVINKSLLGANSTSVQVQRDLPVLNQKEMHMEQSSEQQPLMDNTRESYGRLANID